MTPELLAAQLEDVILGRALACVIAACLVGLYLRWEWRQSTVGRDERELRRGRS